MKHAVSCGFKAPVQRFAFGRGGARDPGKAISVPCMGMKYGNFQGETWVAGAFIMKEI